jgi:hypothetical protein
MGKVSPTAAKELSKYKLDLAVVQEVRWHRGGRLQAIFPLKDE